MIACVDVDYRDGAVQAVAACVVLRAWEHRVPEREVVLPIARVEDYVPGAFYRRELPCILAVLGEVPEPMTTVVVDGYVWLSDDGRPGLGAHLYEALGQRVAVVGVAKNPFAGSGFATEVRRGESQTPLYVTAVGMDVDEAAQHLRDMHGPHRMPTALRRVDRLARDYAGDESAPA